MSIAQVKRAIRSRLGDRGGMVHSFATLVGGTFFAQGLTVLALPLLTRLYTPAEFSVLAVYASILGILSVVACLRMEIAIPLPEREEEAANLLVLALASGLALSCVVALVIQIFHFQILRTLNVPAFAPYLWLVPMGVLFASAYAAFQYWSTRKRKFSSISRTRMTQAIGGVSLQIGTGFVGGGVVGLIAGHLFSSGAGFLKLGKDAWAHDRESIKKVTFVSMKRVAKEYSRFPKYSTVEALANAAGMQLPILLIAAVAAGPEAGFILLATRIMAAPVSLIGGALSQVYLAHASDASRKGYLDELTTQIITGLLKTGVGPLLFVGITAVPLASLVFGSDWARVGVLIAWMTPWFIFQLLSSPISMVLHIKSRQVLALALQVTGLGLRVGAVWLAWAIDVEYLAVAYAVANGIFYAVALILYGTISGVSLSKLTFGSFRSALVVVGGWCVLAVAAFMVASYVS